jgi:Holliday junction resolvasome RuvABC endonuclease subunit
MTASNFCIGAIDPGGSGAIAFLFTGFPNTIASEDMPTAAGDIDGATLADRMATMRPDMVIIERVGAMPKQGVSSTFKFGKAYGVAIGVVAALKIPVHFVTPGTWKKHFNLSADKEEARARALQLWPARAELFARKRDHNRAEAALIARYGAERIVNSGGAP